MKSLRALYDREMFDPGLIGLAVNPFYFARKSLIAAVRASAASIKGRTLGVGCGQKPYQALFAASEYVGLELDTPANRAHKRADFYYDGMTFPFAAASFDSVLRNEVLEHVADAPAFLAEIRRVLKPGGALLLTVSFVWDEHEQPNDYLRYSSFGLKRLLTGQEFAIIEYRKTMPDLWVVFQLVNAYLYKKTVTRNGYVNLLMTLLLMAPFNVLGEIFGRLLPQNEDLYLHNVVLARKAAT
jgi:SAM-dependent methyltransferase